MKKTILSVLAVSSLSLIVWLSVAAQPRETNPAREFMREKLDHAQSVLEGITMENFDLIANHARKLGTMSQEASWKTMDNPDYVQQSELFRRSTDAMVRAARERNLDSATLAYTKMTFSCVECHKYIRGRKAG